MAGCGVFGKEDQLTTKYTNGGGRGFHFVCFMYFVVMLNNLKRSFQRRTILNHDAHRLVCLVRILGLEIIPLVMLAAEKSETSSWSWQDSYAEVDAKGDLKWKPQPFVFEKSRSIRYIEFREGRRRKFRRSARDAVAASSVGSERSRKVRHRGGCSHLRLQTWGDLSRAAGG